ncbi:unnamed protein product [Durusdinium trenchii]|uniref:SAYSvFN domain-containing protein n=2 Tax=Durusdinium trenchii TaxID=1381693 RepID=A0ABP0HRK7_9DINO
MALAATLAGQPGWVWSVVAVWLLTFFLTGFDKVYLILSMIAFIFGPGLGEGRGEYSAYSIFNKGQKHLLGDLRAEQLDAEQRGDHHLAAFAGREQDGGLIDLPGAELAEDQPVIRSRDANQPCPCGSGRKAKRCCFDTRQTRQRSDSSPSLPKDGPDPLLEQWRSEMEVVASGHAKSK